MYWEQSCLFAIKVLLKDSSLAYFQVKSFWTKLIFDGKWLYVNLNQFLVSGKPKGFDEPHEAIFSDCEGKNCLLFQSEELCNHLNSDHNYNAICRNLLSTYAVERGMPEGFLHSMSEEAQDFWDLGMWSFFIYF